MFAMKNILVALALCIASVLPARQAVCAERILAGGSGWNKIALIRMDDGKIDWIYEIPEHRECNSVDFTREKNIIYANRSCARLIDVKKNLLWEFRAAPGEEVHTARQLPSGGYLLGICGEPARIVELDRRGKISRETLFDTGIKGAHGQFRQIAKLKNGNYLVPLLNSRKVVEVAPGGAVKREFETGVSFFSAKELPNGNWLLSGDGGHIRELDPGSGKVVRSVSNANLEGARLLFATEVCPLKNGNLLVSNWNGHSSDKSQPKILQIDRSNRVVWTLPSGDEIGNVSAICLVK